MISTLKITKNRKGLHILSIFVPFGRRCIKITISKPYTEKRSARYAADTIARKFRLVLREV